MRIAWIGLLLFCFAFIGITSCTTAQRQAAVQGASDGGSGAPVAPPSGWDNFAVYLAAYAAGAASKEALRFGAKKIKGSA